MPTFEYQALETQGKRVKGLISADSARAARKELRLRQLTPLKLQEAREKKDSRFTFLERSALSGSDLLLITRQWAMMIGAGTPVEEALQATATQSEKPGVRKVLMDVRTSVAEGYRLAEALGNHPKVFNALYCSIVAAGEASGQLGSVLERLAEYLERTRKVRQAIMTALIYPCVLAVVALSVITGLMTFVVPKVVEQFSHMDQELPMLTQVVIFISDLLRNFGILILIGVVLSVFGFSRMLRLRQVKVLFDKLWLRLPVFGKMLSQINAARFARTLSTLIGNGAPVLESLAAGKGSLQNAVFQDAVAQVIIRVREGSSISRAMKATGVFPPMMVQLATSGETSGQLPDMLLKSAAFMEDEFEATSKVALGLMEPLIILLLGGIIAVVVMSIMLPILQLNANIV